MNNHGLITFQLIEDYLKKASIYGKLEYEDVLFLDMIYDLLYNCKININSRDRKKLIRLYNNMLKKVNKLCPNCTGKTKLFKDRRQSFYKLKKDTKPQPYINITTDILATKEFMTVEDVINMLDNNIEYLNTLNFDKNVKQDSLSKENLLYFNNWILYEIEQDYNNSSYIVFDDRLLLDITEYFVFHRVNNKLYIFGSRVTGVPMEEIHFKNLTLTKL